MAGVCEYLTFQVQKIVWWNIEGGHRDTIVLNERTEDETQVKGEESSLKKRYTAKLVSNMLVLVANVIMQSIIPRALGPVSYGNFNFVTNFFQQLIGFLNFNTSTMFYTRLSQRQDDRGLVTFYRNFILVLGLIVGLFVVFGFALGVREKVWPDQEAVFIVSGALWALLSFGLAILSEMSDAYGLTVKAEIAKLVLKLFGLAIIVIMFWLNLITLTNFFVYQLLLLSISIWVATRIIQKSGYLFKLNWRLNDDQFQQYRAEFIKFCHPLLLFTVVATIQGILERWFLQKYSGSAEQGFFGLAFQIGSISFLFSSAMIPLLAREYSVSFAKNDLHEMKRLFMRYVPMLYTITAYFGCFLAIESHNVMLLFGGKSYSGAVLPIAIMCFFPLHQTYGQMTASLFFATGRTTAYRNIGIAMILLSLPLTYYLIGPIEYGALQGGSTGLAVKMVAITVLSVNVQLLYISRLLKLPFMKLLGHQILIISIFVAVALASSHSVRLVSSGSSAFWQFMFAGAIYSIGIFSLVLTFPALCAMKRDEFRQLWISLRIRMGGAPQ